MRLIITGPRVFHDRQSLVNALATLPKKPRVKTIVCAGEYGVELLAKQYAEAKGLRYVQVEPKWRKYGDLAVVENHRRLLKNADVALVLHDYRCSFTLGFVELVRQRQFPIRIYDVIGLSR